MQVDLFASSKLKIMKYIFSILFIFSLFLTVNGQGSLQKGTSEYSLLNYPDAINHFENYIAKKGNDNTSMMLMLADCYYSTQNYSKARSQYSIIYKKNPNLLKETDLVKYLNSLRIIGDQESADKIFVTYYGNNSEKVKHYNYQKSKIDSLLYEVESIKPINVNTISGEICPVLKEQTLYFSSNRDLNKAEFPGNGKPYMSLYYSTWNENSNEITQPKPIKTSVTTKYNDATLVFGENNRVYFTRNFITKKGKLDAANGEISNLQIVSATLHENEIKDIKVMDFNSKSFNCAHPFVFQDGKGMIFSSDMPGGFGSSDLYYVEIFNDGSTSSPLNLGSRINTAGKELFPTISNDTLFFSSDAHYGLGGLDLYYSVINDIKNPSLSKNMGAPFNSNADDFHFIWTKKGEFAFLSSNRSGGIGDDDLYSVQVKTKTSTIAYNGFVTSSPEKEKLEGVTIIAKNEYDEIIAQSTSDIDGKYEILLPANEKLTLVFSKPEYSTEKINVNTPKSSQSEQLDARLTSYKSLTTKSEIEGMDQIKVDPIYFEYAKADISEVSKNELDKIVFALDKFPTMVIKIESHTDSRGKDEYNLDLSDKRAKATRDYIIEKGIEPERIISAIGYGESRPLNHCKNGIKCTEDEFAINRRSNFIIVTK